MKDATIFVSAVSNAKWTSLKFTHNIRFGYSLFIYCETPLFTNCTELYDRLSKIDIRELIFFLQFVDLITSLNLTSS